MRKRELGWRADAAKKGDKYLAVAIPLGPERSSKMYQPKVLVKTAAELKPILGEDFPSQLRRSSTILIRIVSPKGDPLGRREVMALI